MKTIEKIERVLAKEITCEDAKVNCTLINAYIQSRRNNFETLNFDDVIWERDIPEIVSNCVEYGIQYITISSGFSGMINTLAEFAEAGCKMNGFVKLLFRYSDTPQTAIELKMF